MTAMCSRFSGNSTKCAVMTMPAPPRDFSTRLKQAKPTAPDRSTRSSKHLSECLMRVGNVTVHQGDCVQVMPRLGPVDAIVCDPPYGLEFMGKGWDKLTVYAGGNPRLKLITKRRPKRDLPGE